jgi:hypothetical protein
MTLDLVYDDACHDGGGGVRVRALLIYPRATSAGDLAAARAALGANPCAAAVE